MLGRADLDILRAATGQNRVVLTRDGDFGQIAILGGEPLVGSIRLRPGPIRAAVTIATLDAALSADLDLRPPFVVVAKRGATREVTIRVRHLRRFGARR